MRPTLAIVGLLALTALLTGRCCLAATQGVPSVVEVLGYHKLSEDDRLHFEKFFAAARVLPINDAVIARAVTLRQARKMSLGDSLASSTSRGEWRAAKASENPSCRRAFSCCPPPSAPATSDAPDLQPLRVTRFVWHVIE